MTSRAARATRRDVSSRPRPPAVAAGLSRSPSRSRCPAPPRLGRRLDRHAGHASTPRTPRCPTPGCATATRSPAPPARDVRRRPSTTSGTGSRCGSTCSHTGYRDHGSLISRPAAGSSRPARRCGSPRRVERGQRPSSRCGSSRPGCRGHRRASVTVRVGRTRSVHGESSTAGCGWSWATCRCGATSVKVSVRVRRHRAGRAAAHDTGCGSSGSSGVRQRVSRCCRNGYDISEPTADFWFDPALPLRLDHLPVDARGGAGARRLGDLARHEPRLSSTRTRTSPTTTATFLADAWGPVRVCIAAEQLHGNEALLPLYTALGTAPHTTTSADLDRDVIEEALAEAGLPPTLADAMDSTSLRRRDREVAPARHGPGRRRRRHAHDRLRGRGFFGPVLTQASRAARTPASSGTAASRCRAFPYFYELKRARDRDLDFS